MYVAAFRAGGTQLLSTRSWKPIMKKVSTGLIHERNHHQENYLLSNFI